MHMVENMTITDLHSTCCYIFIAHITHNKLHWKTILSYLFCLSFTRNMTHVAHICANVLTARTKQASYRSSQLSVHP